MCVSLLINVVALITNWVGLLNFFFFFLPGLTTQLGISDTDDLVAEME